jgi:hypothetical protein
MALTVDTSSFDKGIKSFATNFARATVKGLNAISEEILRLSSFEVPHDKGDLQRSGTVEPTTIRATTPKRGFMVGYNMEYAAHLHEHPEYNFQKGRKGKFLEDPIKRNLRAFRGFLAGKQKEAFR